MLSISLLCISIAYFSMHSVTGDETLKCGMESEKTIGTRYDFPHLSGSTLTEIEDHNRVARRAFDSTLGEESFGISYDRDRRVVNGTIAESLENFPWIADLSLHLKVDDYENDSHPFNVHICGGAIISEYFILTAAHCLEKTLQLASHTNWTASLRVSIGEFDQSEPDLLEEHFYVETAIIHEDYNMSDYLVNDIGLIQIRAKDGHGIQFNQHIKPVCLPSASTPYVENNLVLAGGWGISFTEHDILKNYSRYIHTGEVPLVPLSLCQVYCNLFTGGNETDPHCLQAGHLCVGHEEGGTDTCNGDSGGPIVQNINGRFTLMGLTSFGHPTCGKKGYPAIYTNVQYYLSWILTTMKTLSSN